MRAVINWVRPGLLTAMKRRGVTPLVTLQNLSGHSVAKSNKTVCFSKSVWSRATPLILWLPTLARWAMRTYRGPLSSMIESRASRASSPGNAARTSSRKRRLIS